MALDQLITALQEDADKQATSELEQARAEAARVAAQTRDQIVRKRAEFLTRLESDLREETEIELVEARRRSRSVVLGARQRLLDRVFSAAVELLPGLAGDPAYLSSLPAQLDKALTYLGDESTVIRCSPSVATAVSSHVSGRPGCEVEVDPSVGTGFKVTSADGRVEVDYTLDSRLERLRPQLSLEVLKQLETARSVPRPAPGS